MPPTTIPLYVAIDSNNGSIYKHWAIFLDGGASSSKLIFQALGSDGRYRYEPLIGCDPRTDWEGFIKLIHVCDVEAGKVEVVKRCAGSVEIRSDVRGWNCQDYVLDLLEGLERDGVVGGEGYRECKERLIRMQDGLM